MAISLLLLLTQSNALLTPSARLVSNRCCTLDVITVAGGERVASLPPCDLNAKAAYWLSVSVDCKSLAAEAGVLDELPSGAAASETVTLLRCALHNSPRSSASSLPIARDRVGTRLLLSDALVNVWEFRLPQGESRDFHRHYLPYTFVNLGSSLTQAIDEDGSDFGEPNLQREGQVVYVDEEHLGEHGVRNVGDGDFVQFIVEFKYEAAPAKGSPDSTGSTAADTLAAAEARVQHLFAKLKETSPEEADVVVIELQQAQEALAAARCDEQRRQCERTLIEETSGGEAAASALEALVAAGVTPDAPCYRAALRACARGEEGAASAFSDDDRGDWALMLFEDACKSGLADDAAASHALRACVRSLSWLSAREALRTASRGKEAVIEVSPQVLEAVMMCCSVQPNEAAALAREASAALLAQQPDYAWDVSAGYPSFVFAGTPAAPAAMVFIEAALRRLVAAQIEAGPVQSVLRDEPFEVMLDLAPELDDDEWAELVEAASLAAAETLAADLAPLLSTFLDCDEAALEVSATSESTIVLGGSAVEDWVRAECIATWHADDSQLEKRRKAAAKAAKAEEAAKAAALEEASRAAATLRERHMGKWARRNERLVKEAEDETLAKRTPMGVALDNAALDAAKKLGLAVASPSEPSTTLGLEGDDVTTLAGIGEKRAAQLRQAGLGTVSALARLDAVPLAELEAVAKENGLPKPSLTKWCAAAAAALEQQGSM